MDQWRAVVNTVMSLQFSKIQRNSWLAEWLSAFLEGLRSMELILLAHKWTCREERLQQGTIVKYVTDSLLACMLCAVGGERHVLSAALYLVSDYKLDYKLLDERSLNRPPVHCCYWRYEMLSTLCASSISSTLVRSERNPLSLSLFYIVASLRKSPSIHVKYFVTLYRNFFTTSSNFYVCYKTRACPKYNRKSVHKMLLEILWCFEAPSSNPCRGTCRPDWRLCSFLQFLHVGKCPSNR